MDTISTADGSTFDTTSVPHLPDSGDYFNCLAAIDEDDQIVTVGGIGNTRRVLRFTRGDDSWESLPDTDGDRMQSGCGIIRK